MKNNVLSYLVYLNAKFNMKLLYEKFYNIHNFYNQILNML